MALKSMGNGPDCVHRRRRHGTGYIRRHWARLSRAGHSRRREDALGRLRRPHLKKAATWRRLSCPGGAPACAIVKSWIWTRRPCAADGFRPACTDICWCRRSAGSCKDSKPPHHRRKPPPRRPSPNASWPAWSRDTFISSVPAPPTQAILTRLELDGTLIGVDVVKDRRLLVKDANEADLLQCLGSAPATIVVTPHRRTGIRVRDAATSRSVPAVIRAVGTAASHHRGHARKNQRSEGTARFGGQRRRKTGQLHYRIRTHCHRHGRVHLLSGCLTEQKITGG